jgi:ubiquinone/menaquinone biosynthesis C-methylase UbiE
MPSSDQADIIARIINGVLAIFFRLLYHQFAWAYDWIADLVSIRRWKSWTLIVEPRVRDSKALELGCGPGHLQLAASLSNTDISGLDASPQMVQLARRRLRRNNCKANLVLGRAQKLPFPAGSFQKIVMTFPSEYVFDPHTAEQVWRVLVDAGELIILPAAWITGKKPLDQLAAWLFKITTQAPNLNQISIEKELIRSFHGLEEVGFTLKSNIIDLQDSEILLIHAIKESTTG